ncbi:hypothetical protein [Sphingomonas sp.]|uniref:hypothetical protein n=1 Tax=Sphingomonas sp. TaxID=28214 RepID=UPI002DB657BD|nr:hypothetical protein [Sphingomonas sp.]HEU4967598.1 hypothetical protein [Sphingomonas sp.]
MLLHARLRFAQASEAALTEQRANVIEPEAGAGKAAGQQCEAGPEQPPTEQHDEKGCAAARQAAQGEAGAVGMFTDLRGGIFSALFAALWLLSAALSGKAARDQRPAGTVS